MGHTGTLDPIATGVLPVFFGNATKAIGFLQNTDKEYLATLKFGVKTNTKDLTGKILVEEKTNVKKEELAKILKGFIGEIEQIPPMFSAVKLNGVALYKLARKGETVKRKKRVVKIHSLELVEFNEKEQTAKFKVLCSSGTYVRSLIEDVAKKLGTVAVMTSLKRTKLGNFKLKDAYSINDILNNHYNLLSLKDLLDIETININEEELFKIKNGQILNKETNKYILFKYHNQDIALYQSYDKNKIKPLIMF